MEQKRLKKYKVIFKETEISDSTRQSYIDFILKYIRINKEISQVALFSICSKKSKSMDKDFLRNAIITLQEQNSIKVIPGICTPEGLVEINSKEAKDFIQQMKEYSGYDFNPSSCIVKIIQDNTK